MFMHDLVESHAVFSLVYVVYSLYKLSACLTANWNHIINGSFSFWI